MPYFVFKSVYEPEFKYWQVFNRGQFQGYKGCKTSGREVATDTNACDLQSPSIGYRPDKQVPDLFPTWEKQVNMRPVDSAQFRFP